MKIEYAWSEYELRAKKCYKCKWLKLYEDDEWYGKCTVPETRYNKKLIRERCITSKACGSKSFIREGE